MTTAFPGKMNEIKMVEGTMTPKKNATLKNLKKKIVRAVVSFALASCLWVVSPGFAAFAQQQPVAQKPDQTSSDQTSAGKDQAGKDQAGKDQAGNDQAGNDQAGKEKSGAGQPAAEATPAEHRPKSIGGALAKETREAEGENEEEEEEHADLKYSTMVQKLARLTGMSVHGAHLFALILNFAVIVIVLVWAIRKSVPGLMRARNESIQRALEEARKASQEAAQRLTDIENRLRQMDVEIGRMQASAEKEAEAEEGRIKKAAEDDLRKVVESAEQEIAAAAKQIRRELSVHTADLALALARKQINVDSNTDQVLVRNFAAKLAEPPPKSTGSPAASSTRSSTKTDSGKDGR